MATQQELDRLKAAVPDAQWSAKLYGVPASVTLAQWIVESGWGTSTLTLKANNCFGVKHNQKAASSSYVEMPTAEFVAGHRVLVEAEFVRYVTIRDSFMAHAQLLSMATRYKPAMAVADVPEAFAAQLQLCGYSTNPAYGKQLVELMRAYRLCQYDTPPTDHEPAVQLQEAA